MNDMGDMRFLREVRKRSRAPGARAVPYGAKSGKSGGGGKIADDTLETKQIVRLVEAICEGPVKSISQPYMNETPLTDPTTGEANFKGIKVWTRLGTPGQTPIPGFSGQEAETGVDARVVKATPVVRTITDPNTDAAKVQVKIPALVRQDDKGNITKTDLTYRVQYQPNGAPGYIDIPGSPFTLDDEKSSSPVHLVHRFDLTGAAPWSIRVVRETADSNSDKLQNDLYFYSYTEIINQKLTYRNTALLALEAEAEQFGTSVPSRAVLVEGLICKVPSNFDPEARTYTGVWNGTWKDAWTDCPAWCTREMVRNPRFGLGQYVPITMVDDTTLYAISAYCAQPVDNGKGGTEPRFTFNAVLSSRMEAYQLLNSMVSLFRGMIYFATGAVRFVADMPRDPEITVTRANTINGEFTYRGASIRTRHNRINVTYNDPDKFYKRDVVTVEEPDEILKYGLRPKDIVAFGCTSRAQAIRAGRWLLYTERMEGEVLTYIAGPDHADIAPGAVVRVMDPSQMGVGMGGRLRAWSGSSITLDRTVTLEAGVTYELVLHDASRALHYRTVTSAPGAQDTITIDGVMPVDMPLAHEVVWGIRKTTGPDTLWRVLSNREVGPQQYEINALRHEPSKYSLVEQGLDIPDFPPPLLPTGPLPAPTNLRAVEYLEQHPGAADVPSALVTFTRPTDPRVRGVEVAYRRKSDPWRSVDARTENRLLVPRIEAGSAHSFRTRSYDGAGRFSPWSAEVMLKPTGTPGTGGADIPNISNVQLTAGWRSIIVRWDNPAIPNFKQVEVWGAPTNDRATATKLTATSTERHTIGGLTNGQTVHLWSRVRIHAAVPVFSDWLYLGNATTTQIGRADVGPGVVDLTNLDQSVIDAINAASGSAAGDVEAARAYANLALEAQNGAGAARSLAETAAEEAEAALTATQTVFSDAQATINSAVADAAASRQAAAAAADDALARAQEAAGSAGAAAGSSSSAASSASGAEQSASAAQGSATAAQTAAGTATTKAGEAATSATNAAGSASTASTNASASATTLRNAVQLIGNPDFSLSGTGWRTTWNGNTDGLPSGASILTTGGLTGTNVLQTKGTANIVYAAGRRIAVNPSRTYRVRARVKNTGTAAGTAAVILAEVKGDGTLKGNDTVIPAFNVPTGGAWVVQELIYVAGTGAGKLDADVAAVVPALQGNTNTNVTLQWDGVWFEDITDMTLTSQAAAAASTSAANAAASEGNAGQSASAASGSANTATTKAAEASTKAAEAASSASTAGTKAGEAANSAAAAADSEIRARTTSALTLPSVMGTAWVRGVGGDPDTAKSAHEDTPGATLVGGVLTLPAGMSSDATVLTRAVLPWAQGRKYRISMEVRTSAVVPLLIRANARGINDTYGAVSTVTGPDDMSPTAANTWQLTTTEITLGAPAAGVTGLRLGAVIVAAAADAEVKIRRMQIDDITVPTEALGYATAAASSAATASTKAGEAQQSAVAASGSKTDAETARAEASTFAGQASTARTGAESAAAAAAVSETKARLAATSTLPSDIGDGTMFTAASGGSPATIASLTTSPNVTLNANGTLTFPTTATTTLAVTTKGLISYVEGHRYRVTALVRVSGGVTPSQLRAYFRVIGADYASITAAATGDLVPATVGTWTTVSAEWVATSGSDRAFIRAGVVNYPATGTRVIDVASILVEDVTSQTEAALSASAASGHKDTAAASSKAAGDSAIAAAASAQTATTKAAEAEASATSAASSANGASNSAQSAETSRLRARSDAALSFPSGMADFWVHSLTGNGDTLPNIVDANADTTITGGVVTFPANITSNRHILSRATIPWVEGRRYRVTLRARTSAVVPNLIKGLTYGLTGTFTAGSGSGARGDLSPTVANTWQDNTIEFVLAAPTSGTTQLRIGAYIGSTMADAKVEIERLTVEDITVAKEAQGFATAAYDQYVLANAKADAAAQSASVASGHAQTASTKAGQASVSAASAATSAENAEGASQQAWTSSQVAARGMSAGVAKNPVFNDWAAGSTYPASVSVSSMTANGSVTKVTGAEAKYTNAMQVLVGASPTTDGPAVALSVTGHGLLASTNPEFVVAEVEVERLGGSMEGAVVQGVWQTSAGNFYVSATLQGQVPVGGVHLVTFFMQRPANYSGTPTNFIMRVLGTSTTGGATRTANTFRLHRLDYHVVTTNSTVTEWQRAKVSQEGIASAAYGLRVKAGTAGAQLELVALDNPQTGPVSVARVSADNIILDGSITGDHMSLNSVIIRDSAQIGGFSVAAIQKKVFVQGPNDGLWKLLANYPSTDWTTGWVQVGVMLVKRRARYQTELTITMDHAASGSWNSGKPNMSVAQLKWQRKRTNESTWADLTMFHCQSGEWGVCVSNVLKFTDTQVLASNDSVFTQYRLVCRKANIQRHQNMSPWLDNFRVDMLHYKQA